MKVRFYCELTGSSSQLIDLQGYFGITDEEWLNMSDDERYKLVEEWAWNRISIDWEPVE